MGCLTRRLVLAIVCFFVLGSATHLHAQSVTLNPASVPFGNLAAGTTSTKPVRLTNSGSAPLVITSISRPSAPFSESDNCPLSPTSLAPHAFCTINVTFSPSALGPYTGSITITDNASNSPQTINLSGTGINAVTLSPANFNFGQVTLGNSSSPKAFTLKNVQNVSLTITSITPSANFSQTNNCPTSPNTLAAGATCSINVVFSPSSLGAVSGTLSVAHNAFGSPATATLHGTGINPVTLAPSSLTFAKQNIGTTSASKPVTVTNNQPVSLSITSIGTTGDFAETNNCGATLPAGGICTISVTFSPSAAGPRTGQLVFSDNAVGSPRTVALTGEGVAVLLSVSVSPSSATIGIGQHQQFTATGSYNDGSQKDITGSANWSSSNNNVAVVSGGLATGVHVGTATIRAVLMGIGGTATLNVVPPTITSFKAGASTITAGNSTTLTAVFSGGTGTVDNNVGAVTSGTPVQVTPASTTTYTLTVKNGAGTSVTATVTVTVVPPPTITSFTAGASAITPGKSTTLTGVFSGGNGTVDNNVGPVTSGNAVTVTPAATTTYTLTVTNAAGTSVSAAVTVAVVNGLFSSGANLDIVNHTATLLNNGMVLIAGGYATAGSQLPVTPQLYDPAAGTFTPTGSMNTPRDSSAATLLNNGTVLIVGGCCDSSRNPLTSAEIYDPVAGTFTYTAGSTSIARQYHKATLLNNGMVLITGGISGQYGSPPTNIAELYDPAAGTFTQIANPMMAARWNHTATPLNNGTVLITGGQDASFNTLASTELYDPVAGTFTLTANPMNTARAYHTATLLNGGTVLIAGCGPPGASASTSAELYDPVAGTFTTTGSMSSARCFHTATLLEDGTVLVAGGYDPSFNYLKTAELYDPNAARFSSTGNMNTGRYDFRATRLNNGTVLVTGGWPNGPTTAELYTSSTLTPPNLVSIAVTPASATLPVAQAMKHYVAVGTFNSNNTSYTQQLASVTWSSTDSSGTNVAQITNDATDSGVAEGVSLGKATITACAGAICGSANLTIVKALTYTQLTPSTSPTNGNGGCCFAMAFDPVSNSTLLFGGVQCCYSALGDTWQLQRGQWSKLSPANAPSPREGPAMAFDAATNTVVLFGGSTTLFGSCCGDLNDTWIWSGAASTWTQIIPSGLPGSPPARRFDGGQGMAYDPNTGTVVMFGGSTQAGTNPTDTWTWDGVTWTQQSPATSPAGGGGMAADQAGNVVLFNGGTSTTWVWNGTTWLQQFPATTPSAPNPGMAFDTDLNEVVLYGGATSSDTWTWDGTDWTQVFPTNVPHDRYAYPMDYDGAAHAVVIFGGFSSGGALDDTWELAPAP